jgi:hypothetical protein
MNHQSVDDELHFEATTVTAQEGEHGADFVLHGIYFEASDPETGGQHWNFTRVLGSEDEGVCTVKEIQEVTVYHGIIKFELTRNSVGCEFNEVTAKETGVRRLKIGFRVNESTWSLLTEQARLVFKDEPYFKNLETDS